MRTDENWWKLMITLIDNWWELMILGGIQWGFFFHELQFPVECLCRTGICKKLHGDGLWEAAEKGYICKRYPHFNGIFHYKSTILGVPAFMETPVSINTVTPKKRSKCNLPVSLLGFYRPLTIFWGLQNDVSQNDEFPLSSKRPPEMSHGDLPLMAGRGQDVTTYCRYNLT